MSSSFMIHFLSFSCMWVFVPGVSKQTKKNIFLKSPKLYLKVFCKACSSVAFSMF